MTVRSARWRKSSRSGVDSDCVEVNGSLDAVRDSKSPEWELPVPEEAFASTITALKLGRFAL